MFSPGTSLQDIALAGQAPPQFALDALQALHNKQYADEMGLADLPNAYQHEQNMRPLQEQRESVLNQVSQAQIPLMQAQAREAGNRADIQDATKDLNIEQLRSQYGHTKLTNYLNEISGMGPLMQQAGAMVRSMPVGGNLKARQMLKQAGHEDMWNPAWDNMPPAQLAQQLEQTGYSISSASQKWQQAADIANRKAEAMARLEEFKAESRERIASQRVGAARDMKQWELANSRLLDKPTYQSLSARYTEFARQAMEDGRPDEARQYDAEAKRLNAAAMALPTANAQIGNQSKVDVTKLTGGAIPTINPDRTTGAPETGLPDRGSAPKPNTAHSLTDLKKMYPGKSDAELKAAYKAKFGVEPQ